MGIGFLLVTSAVAGCQALDWGGQGGSDLSVPTERAAGLTSAPDALPLVLAAGGEPLGSAEGSPRWAVLALNAMQETAVSEEDLLTFSSAFPAPEPGRCALFGEAPVTKGSRNLRFFIPSSKGGARNSRYFFVRSAASAQRLVVGRLDESGEAHCQLSDGPWTVSMGGFRKEVARELSEVPLLLVPRGHLLISSGEPEGALPGDVVRVGRVSLHKEFPGLEFEPAAFADRNLFRRLQSREENFGVREVMQTTFLVGDAPLTLQLDAGNYIVAVHRARGLSPCLSRVSVPAGGEARLHCPTQELQTPGPVRDDWGYPPPFDRSLAFERFLRQRSNLVIPDGAHSSLAQGSLFPAGRFQALTAEGIREPLAHCENLAQAMNRGELPTSSTTLVPFLRGAAPFLTGWRAPAVEAAHDQDLVSYFVLGNGVYLRPVSVPAAPLVGMPPQHKFRVAVEVPAGNSTDALALLLNGREWRRFVLARGPISDPSSIELEEVISRKEDFNLTFCAWGSKYNSEFLTGIEGVFPFAISRSLCVDADDDGRCSAR